MKKIFIIIALFFASQYTHAQDTLAYLQNIVANKAQYIGKPFSHLYANLPLQIKFFSPNTPKLLNTNREINTDFAFYYPKSANEMYLTYPCLQIKWQTPLKAKQSIKLYNQFNRGAWNTTIYNFYKNAIIKDISIYGDD